MQALPHRYRVKGAGRITGDVELTAERLTMLQSASPAEFDGPGDRWSPETLLVGAVADCFILTFRAIAKASRLSWISLDCDVTGTLDREDRVTPADFSARQIDRFAYGWRGSFWRARASLRRCCRRLATTPRLGHARLSTVQAERRLCHLLTAS